MKSVFNTFIILFLLIPTSTSAQDSLNVSLVSKVYHLWDGARDIAVHGDYAFVATDRTGLRIVDISDPANPEEVGSINKPTFARKVEVTDSFAHVLYRSTDEYRESGLSIVQVTDVENPEEVGYFSLGHQNVYDVTIQGDLAFITCTFYDLIVLDISDPANPDSVTYFSSDEYGATASIIRDSLAFLGCYDGGVRFLDISDPANPVEIGNIDLPGTAKNLGVDGDYVYVACDEAGLTVINISDLANPAEVSNFDPQVLVKRVSISNGFAFVSTATGQNQFYSGGLYILDISDPTDPTEVAIIDTRYGVSGNAVAVSDNIAHVADHDAGLHEFDISDISNPVEVGFIDGPDHTSCVAVSGEYAYIAEYNNYIVSDLWVIDISDPSNPDATGYCHLPGGAWKTIIVLDNYAYVTVRDSGLIIIDVEDPFHPEEVGRLSNIGRVDKFRIQNDLAYLADRNSGIRIVDISEPTSPEQIGIIQLPDEVMSISLSDNYAIIAAYGENAGLYVLDIEDPDNPEQISFLQLNDEYHFWGIWDIAISGDYAYATGSYEHEFLQTLSKIDISDPENPVLEWTTSTFPNGFYLTVENNQAFIPAAWDGFHIYDLGNREEIGYYQLDYYGYNDVAISGNYAYVSESNNGLHIYDISLAMNQAPKAELPSRVSKFTVLPPYPNPFNSQLIIPIELSKNGIVRITLSNILGQRLFSSKKAFDQGLHSLVFDAVQYGLELPNGAYFFKIQFEGNEEVRKVYHIK